MKYLNLYEYFIGGPYGRNGVSGFINDFLK